MADETIGVKLSVSSSDEPTRQLFVCFDDALLVQCDLAPEDQHPGYQPTALAREEFASVDEKIRYFLHEMTLEEKLLQMNLRPPPDKATPGLGAYSQVSIPRLSLGGIRGTDGPRGPRPNGGLPAGRTEDGHNGPVSPTSLVWRPTGTRRCMKKRAASGGCSARNTA